MSRSSRKRFGNWGHSIEPTALSLLPPLLAIGLAIASRQVYLSLAAGIVFGNIILADWNPLVGLAASVDSAVAVLGDSGNASVLLFTLVIGALIATLEMSGGVRGFIARVEDSGWVRTPRHARMTAWLIGTLIFIESNITVLISGAIARPLFDRFRLSREKLAYLIDSTSAPVCILIPLNAWGAYVLGLLVAAGVDEPLPIFIESIPLNFYALLAWGLAGWVAFTGLAVGPMRTADLATESVAGESTAVEVSAEEATMGGWRPRASTMILPILVMLLVMPVGLYVTGEGNFADGSGSTSVLWAVLAAVATAWALVIPAGARINELVDIGLKGAGNLLGLALILLLALALGAVTRELGTGQYVAGVVEGVFPPPILLPLIFIVAAFVAFSTGTSWGTFAIMVPIAVPAAAAMGMPIAPFLAATLSGGVFGDHASPISDTTIVSSMSAAVDHISHVRTQIPYALLAGAAAVGCFAVTGLVLG